MGGVEVIWVILYPNLWIVKKSSFHIFIILRNIIIFWVAKSNICIKIDKKLPNLPHAQIQNQAPQTPSEFG